MDEVRSYKEEFLKLKETLDWCVKTEIWRTVLKIGELKLLVLLLILSEILIN